MPHDIYDERFLGNRTPAWHGLGEVFTDEPTATEALIRAKLDLSFATTPLRIQMPGQVLGEDPRHKHCASPVPVLSEHPTQVQLWRIDPHQTPDRREEPVAIVGRDYTWMDNADIAEMIDPLTEAWPVETVGALKNGEHLFFCLQAGTSEIAGDELRDFFVIHDHRDGASGLEVLFAPVRVVCQNTLMAAQEGATTRITVRHDKDFRANAALYTDLMARMRGVRTRIYDSFLAMSERRASMIEVSQVLGRVYRSPKQSDAMNLLEQTQAQAVDLFSRDIRDRLETMRAAHAAKRQWANHSRSMVHALFDKIGDEYPRIAGTQWALYNAVVEWEDHGRIERQGSGSAIFGERAGRKELAFSLLSR